MNSKWFERENVIMYVQGVSIGAKCWRFSLVSKNSIMMANQTWQGSFSDSSKNNSEQSSKRLIRSYCGEIDIQNKDAMRLEDILNAKILWRNLKIILKKKLWQYPQRRSRYNTRPMLSIEVKPLYIMLLLRNKIFIN